MRRSVFGVLPGVLAALVLTGCEAAGDGGRDDMLRDLDGKVLDSHDLDADDGDDGRDSDDLDADDGDDGRDSDDLDADDGDDGRDSDDLDADDGDDGRDSDDLDADDGDDGRDSDDLDADDGDDGEDSPRRWDVETSGLAFVPAYLEIRAGDSIRFDLGDDHDAVEVEEATWNANGSNPKAGGFSVGLGQKIEVPFPVAGTYYYVCTPHVDLGMKGRIVVKP